ncbi:MAG: group I truncated hemoglobin [Acidimicrobiales bacterium]
MELLERLGGPMGVRSVTDALYDRLLADDEIGPLFAETHLPVQRAAMAAYLVALCSGTASSAGERLRLAHVDQGVTDRHFSIMTSHLADVLGAAHADEEAAADLLELVTSRRADVVSVPTVADSGLPLDPGV